MSFATRAEPGRQPRDAGEAGRVVRAAWVGHAIEWYEFSIYGVLAVYLSAAIFPTGDDESSLILTWSAFALAFVVRPIGGIVLARISDRLGRRRALFASVALMTLATGGIALVPSSLEAGAFAVGLFLALRMLQGLAVGGEMPSAVPYVVESVDPTRRVRSLSWLAVGTFASSLVGAVFAAALAALLPAEQMAAWGWRVPFLLALPLGILALWMRHRVPESAVFRRLMATAARERHPLRAALREQARAIVVFAVIAIAFNVALATALTAYQSEVILEGIAASDLLLITVLTYATLVGSIVLFAPLSRILGRRGALLIGLSTMALAVLPAVSLARHGAMSGAILGAVVLAIAPGMLATPVYLSLAEFFPPAVRSTASGLSFNVATAVSSLVPATTLALRGAGFLHGAGLWVWGASSMAAIFVIVCWPRERYED